MTTPADLIAQLRKSDALDAAVRGRITASTPGVRQVERVDEDSGAICYEVWLRDPATPADAPHPCVHFSDRDVPRAKAEAELYAHARADMLVLLDDRRELRTDLANALEAVEESFRVCMMQSDLLTGVVNAIRGEPGELRLHSHHDAPDLVQRLINTIRHARVALQALAEATDLSGIPADTRRNLGLDSQRERIAERLAHLTSVLTEASGLA